MAVTTELADGTTEASTSTIAVPLNGTVTVGIFGASGIISAGARADIFLITPSGNRFCGQLTNGNDMTSLATTGDYIITRRNCGPSFGIYSYKT